MKKTREKNTQIQLNSDNIIAIHVALRFPLCVCVCVNGKGAKARATKRNDFKMYRFITEWSNFNGHANA